MKSVKCIGKVWKAGTGTRVVTLDKNVRELLNIDYDDMIELSITKVIRKQDKKRFVRQPETKKFIFSKNTEV